MQSLFHQTAVSIPLPAACFVGTIDVPAGYTSVAFLSATLVFFAAAWRMPIMDVDYVG